MNTSNSKQRRSLADYTVACICPMGIELAPVISMLDHKHESLPTKREQNTYTFGSIGCHNVVVAVLLGTRNDATARMATQLLCDFPSIRVALLVGIGSGVPGDDEESDIRLGDVVVSKPTATFGGVVQYDLGKKLADGRFARTGHLNKPPGFLSGSVSHLQALHIMKGSQISKYIADMFQRYPRMQAQYSFPSEEEDQLFATSYQHRWGSTCHECDPSYVVARPARLDKEPQIHYGTIGSANLIVKDPSVRDALRRDTDILCVEMGAAGLMDILPSLVIRGICDYADSHTNDRWQPYASAVAAAYMKELLMIIPNVQSIRASIAEEVTFADTRTHELLEEGNQLQKDMIRAVVEQSSKIEARYKAESKRKCHRLFRTSPYERFKDINPERADRTCRWVLDHSLFRAWRQSKHHNLLWISADPWCGKSVLSKYLVDHEFGDSEQHSVCYFFFKDNEHQDNMAAALCAIIHQLFQLQPELLSHRLSAWVSKNDSILQNTEELWHILVSAATESSVKSIICVLDALDECRGEDRRQLITKLCQFYQQKSHTSSETLFKFLVTSRPYDSVQRWFEQTTSALPQIRLRGENENDQIRDEINLVIDQRVDSLATEFALSNQVSTKLRRDIKQLEHRTYLWLHLAMENIREICRDSLYDDEIHIEILPQSVEGEYERILSRINGRQRKYACKILSIIVAARRPLTMVEMANALNSARVDELNLSYLGEVCPDRLEKQIREVCGLFVFINHSCIFLIHQTAKEFLIAQSSCPSAMPGKWKSCLYQSEIETDMARLCMTYLRLRHEQHWCNDRSLQSDQSASVGEPPTFSQSSGKSDTFFDYCAEHWTSHLRDSAVTDDGDLLERALALYATDGELFHSWFPIMWRALKPCQPIPEMHIQHVVAMSNHALVLKEILQRIKSSRRIKHVLQERDSTGRTALHWALERGHARVVQVLLDNGTDFGAQGGEYGTALQAAVCEGHEEVVQILLRRGAHGSAKRAIYAPYRALARGYEEAAQVCRNIRWL